MGGPKRALLALFWAPGGLGPIRKRQFGRHAKTAAGNGSNPIRLLKCHVRREKGPTRGPRGPSVAGRGAHVSPMGNFSGGQTKQIEVPDEPPEAVSVTQPVLLSRPSKDGFARLDGHLWKNARLTPVFL